MKKQISSVLLALSLFSLNSMPARASVNSLNKNAIDKSLMASGQWCFELPWMGIFCYDL